MDNYVKDLLNYRFVANTIPAVSELNKPQSISTKKSMAMKEEINLQQEVIISKIYEIRGVKFMLDRDLAELYDVKSIRLREQVKRNPKKFPEHFMFQLTGKEANDMVSQNAIPSNQHLGGSLFLRNTYKSLFIAL